MMQLSRIPPGITPAELARSRRYRTARCPLGIPFRTRGLLIQTDFPNQFPKQMANRETAQLSLGVHNLPQRPNNNALGRV